MSKRYARFLTAVFCLFLGGLMVWQMLLPDRERSDVENRTLQQRPALTLSSVLDGSYMEDVEAYVQDQFPLRDQWTGLKARTEQLIGKRLFNNIYLCEGETLISKVDAPADGLEKANLNYVSQLAEKSDIPMYLGLIPSAAEVWRDKLPEGAESWDQNAYLSQAAGLGLPMIDFSAALTAHADEPIFYRTDHHWTTEAAYYVYAAWAEEKGLSPLALSDYKKKTLTDGFFGTVDAKVGGRNRSDTIHVYIPKKNGKLRPLSIPTMTDRAMQTLYKFALEPLAETYGDPNSYGFRIGRSTHDAIEQCFTDLNKGKSPQWILEGDIKGCFDHISHEWLMENIPMDTQVLQKWLKCGYVDTKQLFPTEEGTPQGGAISPTLMNMTLDGLERLLKERLPTKQYFNGKTHFNKMNFVRYADDFIVTGESPEFLREEVLPIIRDFMTERGLQLSEEKTVITHINDGFDFLGKNIRKYNGKLLIKPSKQSVGSLLKKVREIVKSNKSAKQDSLIRQLNPVIRGWVNNQRFVVSAETFSKIDYQIYNCLWQWAKRRHKKKSRRWIAKKYWHCIGSRNWTFAAEERSKKRNKELSYFALEYATDTKIIRFKKIVSNANPFDERWSGYYEERDGEKMLNSTNGREKLLKVWRNQHRCCPVCGEPITSDTGFKVHKVFRHGKSPWLEMVHPECHTVLHKNDACFVAPGSLTGTF